MHLGKTRADLPPFWLAPTFLFLLAFCFRFTIITEILILNFVKGVGCAKFHLAWFTRKAIFMISRVVKEHVREKIKISVFFRGVSHENTTFSVNLNVEKSNIEVALTLRDCPCKVFFKKETKRRTITKNTNFLRSFFLGPY